MLETLKVMAWIFLAIAVLVGIFVAGKKGAFDKFKASYKGTQLTFNRERWLKIAPYVLTLILVFGLALAIVGCSSGGNEPPAPVAFNCAGQYVGSVDMPPHEERIAARNEGLKRKGIPITGDDAIDNRAQGGGDPDGGMWLSGDFNFTADASCVVTGSVSIFGHPFALNGVVQPDGKFTLDYLAPLFVGQVNADNTITGKLMHGGGEEYIYGYLNGKKQ